VAKLDRLSRDVAFINELELSRGHDDEHCLFFQTNKRSGSRDAEAHKRPREGLGLLEGLLAVCLVWTEPTAGDVFPVKVFARAAVGEANLVAAAFIAAPLKSG
jgi:hypothetical protein